MAYQFASNEPVADGVRRIVQEEVHSAAQKSKARTAPEKDEAIHEIRKSLKRIRGLLKLMEPALGPTYRQQAGSWRELARRLSPLRDAAAMLGALEEMRERCPHLAQGAIRRRLVRGKRELEQKEDVSTILKDVVAGLKQSEAKLKSWPLEGSGFGAVAPGLQKTYKSGVKAFRAVQSEPSAENLHRLRRRAKEHLFQVRLLEGLWDGKLRRHESKVGKLEETLGSHQNLAVMKTKILELPTTNGTAAAVNRFLAALEEQEKNLAEKAIKLGSRVYEESPSQVKKQTRHLWKHWADL